MASSRYASASSRSPPPSLDLRSLTDTSSSNHTTSVRPSAVPSRALASTRPGSDPAPSSCQVPGKRSNPKPEKGDRTAPAKGGANFPALHRKLFQKGDSAGKTEAKTNTRTLAMVLRNERELLSRTKDQEAEISALRSLLEEKNQEVDKLRDLCMKQREEIEALKDATIFPGVMESKGSNMKEAKQIECSNDDRVEVNTDKYAERTCFDGYAYSPRTPRYHEAAHSLEYSSGDPITSGYDTPDDMFLKDLNPCLTPCFAKNNSKEFDDRLAYEFPVNVGHFKEI